MTITFHEQLIITIVGAIATNLIFAGLLTAVTFYFNKRLAKYNSDRQQALQKELADLREKHEEKIEDFRAALALAVKRQDQDFSLNLQMRQEQQDLARGLRDLEAQKDLQIAAARLPAYQKLWEIQESTADSLGLNFSPDDRKKLENDLRSTFFRDGNGILLTHSAFGLYLAVMDCLHKEESTPKDIRKAFSAFRTKLKEDVKVYNKEEAQTPARQVPGDKGTNPTPEGVVSPATPQP